MTDGIKSGSVDLDAKAVNKTGAYIFQMSKDKLPTSESEWIIITTTVYCSYTVEGLTPVCYYYFRVAAVTPAGILDFCAPVKKLVV